VANVPKRRAIFLAGVILMVVAFGLAGKHEWKLQSARTQSKPSSVHLNWAASPSPKVTGYNVYRTFASGVGYVRLNSAPVKERSYVDSTISEGRTYYYAVTAVDDSGNESSYSKEIRIEVR
jgi:fibronectin type 3 domain-containing protein